jgi:shikimate kinase
MNENGGGWKNQVNIYLIGYRCTGKTTVGRWLADRLGWGFVDSDEEIVRTHGMTIQHVVRAQGWEAFREKERQALARIARLDSHVVATGGGAVLDPGNVRRMKDTGTIYWLKATPGVIRRRMSGDGATGTLRPSLTSRGTDDEVEPVLAQRTPLYRAAADVDVDTDGRSPEEIGQEIITAFERKETGARSQESE